MVYETAASFDAVVFPGAVCIMVFHGVPELHRLARRVSSYAEACPSSELPCAALLHRGKFTAPSSLSVVCTLDDNTRAEIRETNGARMMSVGRSIDRGCVSARRIKPTETLRDV